MNNHPEDMLIELTTRTKSTIDECFEPKLLSNRAKKGAEEPWIDRDITKQERKQTRLFRKFASTKDPTDRNNYNSFRRKLTKTKTSFSYLG